LRVTGGELRGRRIRVPRSSAVRPTADRVREALFARLGDLEGVRALDLFGGSGSLGIEALSRGASYVVFVERSVPVAAVLQANLVELGIEDRSHVVRGDAAGVVRRLAAAGERFDLALLDPPYGEPESAHRTLRALATSGILAPRATVVVEASRRHPPQQIEELEAVDERRYGDTVIHRFESAPGLEHARRRESETSLEPVAAAANEEREEDEETA
jgi:16S rRNA (guanine966-N2)-methyltransferase